MLVGATNINDSKLKDACKTTSGLIEFSDSLVPPYFRHIKEIVYNQRYITAVCVRNLFKNDYNKWKPLCDKLLEGVHITGSITDLYECSDLLAACNLEVLKSFLNKEG